MKRTQSIAVGSSHRWNQFGRARGASAAVGNQRVPISNSTISASPDARSSRCASTSARE